MTCGLQGVSLSFTPDDETPLRRAARYSRELFRFAASGGELTPKEIRLAISDQRRWVYFLFIKASRHFSESRQALAGTLKTTLIPI